MSSFFTSSTGIKYQYNLQNGSNSKQTQDGFEIIELIQSINTGDDQKVLLDMPNTPWAIGTVHPKGWSQGILSREINIVPMGEICQITVSYRSEVQDSQEDVDANGEIWQWDISSEQVHIQSVETEDLQTHFPPSEDTGVGIGVDGEDIHGTDVLRPSRTIRVSLRDTKQNTKLRKSIADELASTVNDQRWKGYEIGEVLFQNASIIQESQDFGNPETLNWRISYNFTVRRQRGSVSVSTTSGPVTPHSPGDPERLAPWDFISYTPVQVVEDGVKRTLIESVHVAQTQDSGRFARFNLKGGEFK